MTSYEGYVIIPAYHPDHVLPPSPPGSVIWVTASLLSMTAAVRITIPFSTRWIAASSI